MFLGWMFYYLERFVAHITYEVNFIGLVCWNGGQRHNSSFDDKWVYTLLGLVARAHDYAHMFITRMPLQHWSIDREVKKLQRNCSKRPKHSKCGTGAV